MRVGHRKERALPRQRVRRRRIPQKSFRTSKSVAPTTNRRDRTGAPYAGANLTPSRVRSWKARSARTAVQVGRESERFSLNVRVQAGASKTEVTGLMADGSLKVKLKAPPVRGRANRELVSLLAGVFRVSASSVRIVSGLTSKQKRVLINDVSRSSAEKLMARALLKSEHDRVD
ncbi:MAG: YggU family protein [Candidatus Eiseniibacteriota bacterium]|nr:MAG: YggU family protein [Candidatus Eisenbacteria bacterium]